MEIFTDINQVKEFYFPSQTAKEKEEEFMKTATPKQIGEYWAKQIMEKLRTNDT